ncbi:MAG: polyprenyl synthetase family protein [Microthrixaceae bacterium]
MPGPNPLSVLPSMEGDLQRVESQLLSAVRSDEEFLTEIASHLITAGGKRVRPGFCIASAATTLSSDTAASAEVITGGVAVELVHLGSLYHDDVMDEAATRRSVQSVNSRWGNLRAILAGDFLLARASELAAGLGTEVAGLLAATIGRLCEGQLLELQHAFDPCRTEESYLRSIGGKTAALLESACRIGGLVAGVSDDHLEALTTFGHSYGMAFQMVDDVLDLVCDESEVGKPVGHDLEEGTYTLPVLFALAGPDGEELASMLHEGIDEPTRRKAIELVAAGEGIPHTIDRARQVAGAGRAALGELPPSPGMRGLDAAAAYLLETVETAAR